MNTFVHVSRRYLHRKLANREIRKRESFLNIHKKISTFNYPICGK